MAGDWLSIVGSKGGKASAPNQMASHVEQVATDNESEVAYVRAVMENLPTLARSPVFGQAAGPKMGKVSRPYISGGVWYPPARRPGAKHTSLRQAQDRPKVTKNGHSERSNLTVALERKLEQGTTRKRCREGWPKKLMPGVMPRIQASVETLA